MKSKTNQGLEAEDPKYAWKKRAEGSEFGLQRIYSSRSSSRARPQYNFERREVRPSWGWGLVRFFLRVPSRTLLDQRRRKTQGRELAMLPCSTKERPACRTEAANFDGAGSRHSPSMPKRILTGILSILITIVQTAPRPLAMGVPGPRSHQISIPAFRDAGSSAIQLRRSIADVEAGQHAKVFADLALESRLNCSLRLDLSPDFQVLGGKAQSYSTAENKHVFCRTNSLGNSLALMRRAQSDEALLKQAQGAPWSWGQGIARVGSFGKNLIQPVMNGIHDHPEVKDADGVTASALTASAPAHFNGWTEREENSKAVLAGSTLRRVWHRWVYEPSASMWHWAAEYLNGAGELTEIEKAEERESVVEVNVTEADKQAEKREEAKRTASAGSVEEMVVEEFRKECVGGGPFGFLGSLAGGICGIAGVVGGGLGIVGGVGRGILPCFGEAEWQSMEEGMRDAQAGLAPEMRGNSFGGGVLNYELGPNATVEEINDDLVRVVVSVIDRCDWSQISNADGITVFRTQLPPALSIGGRVLGSAAKFYCVKATGMLDAPPEQVYQYFLDNERVHEYNEFCKQVRDIEFLNDDTKITWSASGRVGPFKERDFVTRVHFRTLPDGTLLVANRAEHHDQAPESAQYLRMEITLGANMLKPVEGQPNKTLFTLLTHVNPGGVAETRIGTMIMNSAAAAGPIKFIQSIRGCIQRDADAELQHKKEESEQDEFERLLQEQVQMETSQGRSPMLNTCPAGVT